ncbi:DNA polymerase III subunit beta [Paenibacillus sp. N1-5-1-14]|uniref:DNA polymerase III subunit beta n=1 Tax=Paenibacillus radicibacter TaxID=2972488 RepID=UPI0021595085|nr:DNA polymerase III subunit beta [Paenibacillus radicibacter]MCR8642216.1 DNA polymerase III subunit beta [Paenibacillus radicibacter]
MQLAAPKSILLQAIRRIIAAVPTKSLIPILSGIHMEAHLHGITLTASQISMTLQTTIPIQEEHIDIKQYGSCVIPAKYALDIIRHLPDGIVMLSVDSDNKICIQSEQSIYHLCGMNPEEYPALAQVNYEHTFQVPSDLFKKMIKQVAFSISTSEVRPILTGISCTINDTSLRLTATDGVRLASALTTIQSHNDIPLSIVFPGKFLTEYCKIVDNHETLQIDIGKQIIRIHSNQVLLQTTRLEGVFPGLEQLVPPSCITELTVCTAKLLQALERVSLLADRVPIIRLHTHASQLIELSSQTIAVGDVCEQLAYETFRGEPIRIHFNGNYLIDILRHMDDTHVTLQFISESRAIVVKPANFATSLYILAPSRTHS